MTYTEPAFVRGCDGNAASPGKAHHVPPGQDCWLGSRPIWICGAQALASMRHLHHISYHTPKPRYIHSRGSQAKGGLDGGVCEGGREGLRRSEESWGWGSRRGLWGGGRLGVGNERWEEG